jgi:hypothetical protein
VPSASVVDGPDRYCSNDVVIADLTLSLHDWHYASAYSAAYSIQTAFQPYIFGAGLVIIALHHQQAHAI